MGAPSRNSVYEVWVRLSTDCVHETASQASEMLVSELAVIRRFVGPPDPPPSRGG